MDKKSARVGMRVKYLGSREGGPVVGSLGVVVVVVICNNQDWHSDYVGVAWDGFKDGHDCDQHCKNRCGYNVPVSSIIPVAGYIERWE
jgi:hypothetical protein